MTEQIPRFSIKPKIPNWTDGSQWINWQRHEEFLRAQSKWKPHQVDSVAEESLRIICKTKPIQRLEFQCRGLVVGYVQSGKTANFTAVAARAADVGYRLIVVLSGIHDSLRNQTQKRLNRELVSVGVNWTTLTSESEDFQTPAIANGFDGAGTVLVVAKKTVPILRRINQWIIDLEGQLENIPVLLIDDEADQASINTKGNRKDPSVDDEPEVDSRDPSITNSLIRDTLQRIPRATYIAYTATPFANILIDPDAVDRAVGADLFPKDFVVQLPRPEGYIGTEELFGVAAAGRDVMRAVAENDVRSLKTKRKKKGAPLVVDSEEGLPQSLCDAVLMFVVIGAIRLLRNQTKMPHTMLVHVSHKQVDQIRIGSAIQQHIKGWRDHERVVPGSLRQMLSSALTDLGMVDLPAARDIVLDEAMINLSRVQVVVLNSLTGEELGYDEKPGCQLIAVGGNRLSRGLTLEGLTVAYFLRTTTMADSLLQMARWYGFRAGYDDLIRIWTTEGIAQWFVELALVEESLRDSITAMNRAGRRPDEMAIKMRSHSDLLLTSKNKSKMLEVSSRSWSGENPQTILFPLRRPDILEHNTGLTAALLTAHTPTQEAYGGSLVHDVPAARIEEFLRSFIVHDDTLAFRGDLIADWISERTTVGELTSWTIFVANPSRDRQVLLGTRSFGLVHRSLTGAESIGILIDPRHEGVDLHGGPDFYRTGQNYNARAMRQTRPSSHGLLMIYPLDPQPLQAQVRTVIGIALSFPKTSDESQSFVVNRGVNRE
ncbi:Z1 domain-containing protein [Rugamonas aquatica]|uniref:Putative endonuclease Z1 domain-containing protein n=1 Tax=Rugamonas aquatica TaxID=2743357 RepID=A0A6A7NBA8_9BURK|nr:Z1 domain-containing protein [Rugamonas aquatica]MQA42268.1 hypothetical protein [Rugamonas aquatica]